MDILVTIFLFSNIANMKLMKDYLPLYFNLCTVFMNVQLGFTAWTLYLWTEFINAHELEKYKKAWILYLCTVFTIYECTWCRKVQESFKVLYLCTVSMTVHELGKCKGAWILYLCTVFMNVHELWKYKEALKYYIYVLYLWLSMNYESTREPEY